YIRSGCIVIRVIPTFEYGIYLYFDLKFIFIIDGGSRSRRAMVVSYLFRKTWLVDKSYGEAFLYYKPKKSYTPSIVEQRRKRPFSNAVNGTNQLKI
ncbi:hypothetical protein KM917_05960, partial [Virgibacillus pantothenticus]|uniref:hypothetical protein n=1 Tax=Virgibacillus pantothenticus TaxID=1473 RepID=UPI001C20F6C1